MTPTSCPRGCAAVAFALSIGLSLAPGLADAQFRVCPRYTPSGTSVVIRSHHGFYLSTINQPSPWPANASFAYDQTWQGWWYLNTNNYAWWWTGNYTTQGYSGWDGTEAVQRENGFNPLAGQTQPYVWPADQIQEADFRIDGPTNSGPATATNGLAYTSTCIAQDTAQFNPETMVLLHELGHGYGFGHMDDWLSAMNSVSSSPNSCELGNAAPGSTTSMLVTPDPEPTQCMSIVYGIPAGIDISITPVVQPTGCFLANGCAQRHGNGPTLPQSFAHTATTGTTAIPVEFTQLNNRDGYGTLNPVTAIYFSLDAYLDASDVRVFATTIPGNGNLQGEVHGRSISFSFNPTTALPLAGSLYRALVVVDDTNVIAETREGNNITDTRYWYTRM